MHGVYLLWWVQERHVSAAVAAGVLASGDVILAALEWPTGWFADRCGHRASLIVGSCAQVLGMVLCWLATGVSGLLAASVLVAVGDAFRSGADHALLYRSCVAQGREDRFLRVEAGARSIALIALVTLTLVGGALVATAGFAAGWILEIAFSVAGLGIACSFVEPRAADRVNDRDAAADRSAAAAGRAVATPRRTWTLLGLMLPAAVIGAVNSVGAFAVQIEGERAGQVAVVVAALTLAEAAGAALAARWTSGGLRVQVVLLATAAGGLTAAWLDAALFTPVVVVLSVLVGVAEPLRAAALQRLADDGMRARAASLASACDKGLAMLALMVFGYRRSA